MSSPPTPSVGTQYIAVWAGLSLCSRMMRPSIFLLLDHMMFDNQMAQFTGDTGEFINAEPAPVPSSSSRPSTVEPLTNSQRSYIAQPLVNNLNHTKLTARQFTRSRCVTCKIPARAEKLLYSLRKAEQPPKRCANLRGIMPCPMCMTIVILIMYRAINVTF